ncbi:SprT family zinc-dependent metalloprotease [Limihaloglobus sulfuriphilus]
MHIIRLGDIDVDVVQKDIKNLHLSVYPPTGRVHISAPLRMNLETIRIFAISKLGWIKKQQAKLVNQKREAPREYISRESHRFLGKRYLLKIIEHDAPPKVEIKHKTLEMYVRPNTDTPKRHAVLEEWYRQKLKEMLPELIEKLEKKIPVRVAECRVKKMKTKWGTCNVDARRIWVNLELAKKPLHCLEYILVHEMTHLLERHHNSRFVDYMDHFLPQWRSYKDDLNRYPVSHIDWKY